MHGPRPADLSPPSAGRAPLPLRMSSLRSLDAVSLQSAVAELPVPAYIIDRNRRFRWLNRAAVELLGERIGQPFCRIVAPEHARAAQTQFARRILRGATNPHQLTLIDREGRRTQVSIVSSPLLEEGRTVGVFGLAFASGAATERQPPATAGRKLTPRQSEILGLLALGHDTNAIAECLGVGHHTVRNHMRGLFRELGVHSRLHAVARGYQAGLLDLEHVLGDGRDDL